MEECLTMTEVAHLSERDCKSLERRIKEDAPKLTIKRVQLGNGEWVIVLGTIYIWNEDDWERSKNDPDIVPKRMIA